MSNDTPESAITPADPRIRPLFASPPDLRVDAEFKSLCPALLPTEHSGLVESLLAEGCRDRIVVWHESPDGRWLIVDGHNRFEVCKQFGLHFDTAELLLEDRDDIQLWIMNNQFGRRNLTDGARALLAVAYKKKLEEVARKHKQELIAQQAAQKPRDADGHFTQVPSTLTEPGEPDEDDPADGDGPSEGTPDKTRAPDSRDNAAAQAKISTGTLTKAEYIVDHASKETLVQIAAGLNAGQTTVNKEYQRLRDAEKKTEREEIARKARENPPPPPVGPFSVVLADPPWQYDHEASANRDVENQYTTMSVDDICDLMVGEKSVRSIIADDAVLYLWTTSPKLPEGLRVMGAWGFEFKTCLAWVKRTPDGKLQIGMGYWARQCHELLLVGTRGKIAPPPTEARPASVIEAPRTKHSAKPEEAYEIIEESFASRPEYQKLELFARAPRVGWAVWGNDPAVNLSDKETSDGQ